MSRDLPAVQQRVAGSSEDLSVRVPRTRRASLARRVLLAVSRDLVDDQWRLSSAPTALAQSTGVPYDRSFKPALQDRYFERVQTPADCRRFRSRPPDVTQLDRRLESCRAV